METNKCSTFARGKMVVLLVCVLCFSISSFSQKPAGSHYPVVKFGSLDTTVTSSVGYLKNKPSATWQQFLSDTRLTCLEPGYTVTGFMISFLPKGMDFRGPYKTTGSELKDETVAMIKENLIGNEKCKVFIEAIHVNKNGQDVELRYPMMFTITN